MLASLSQVARASLRKPWLDMFCGGFRHPLPAAVNINQCRFIFLCRSLAHEHPSFSQVSFIPKLSGNLGLFAYVHKTIAALSFAVCHLLPTKREIGLVLRS